MKKKLGDKAERGYFSDEDDEVEVKKKKKNVIDDDDSEDDVDENEAENMERVRGMLIFPGDAKGRTFSQNWNFSQWLAV